MDDRIELRQDLSEKVQYNRSDFPVYLRHGILSHYPNYAASIHWHDDIELIAIHSGQMDYNINGEIVHMEEGDGIFVNARQLHYGFNTAREDCEFTCLLLHPVLLSSSLYIEQQYLSPILTNESLPYLLLRRSVEWERSILEDVQKMYDRRNAPAAELLFQSLFYDIWWQLYTNLNPVQKPLTVSNRRLSSLKAMITYIEANYQNKITLEEICAAGSVGKTTCCKLFAKYVNQTPNVYLVHYRLRKAAELLLTTDMNIAEVCYETGFSGASYFTEMFRKSYGCSPSEYRKQKTLSAEH